MKKTMFTLFLLVLGFVVSYGQRNISGMVMDDKSEPLAGASVLIKGTTDGTVTDLDGKFNLRAPSNAVLVVSYTGYVTKEVTLDGVSNTVSVVLEADKKLLDEVVVTAYGLERKRNELSVSAQKVNGDELNVVRTNDFVNALQGKVAGLDIRSNNSMGASTNVVLRGYKSITGNNQALFVIDGVPASNATLTTSSTAQGREGYDYGSSAADINPLDIENITVLKGAAAALYGSRGANGVVLITTKKGKKDQFDVTLNSGFSWGTIDKSTFITQQDKYGGGYGPDFYTYSGNPGFLGSDFFTPGVEEPFVPFTEDASYGAAFDPNLLVYDWRAMDPNPNNPHYKQKTPWVAAKNPVSKFYETGFSSNQGITIQGGGKTTTFKVGYNRNDEKGVMPNSKLYKNMFNLGGSIEPNSKFKVSTSLNFTNEAATGRYGVGYGNRNVNTSFRQWYQTNVDILDLKEAYELAEQNATWNWAGVGENSPIYWDNPYFARYKNYTTDSRNRYFGNITAQYTIVPGLSLVGRAGADISYDQQEERNNKKSVDLGLYNIYNRSYKEYNYDLFANFNKDLTDAISLDVTAGTNIRRSYLYSIFSTTNTDLVVDGLYSISNSAGTPVPPSESYVPIGVDGLFATATLGFNKYLFLDGTFRRDQSTTLPEGNNTYNYPSVSLGFVFSELLKQDWLDYGKLRLSYTEVGNDAPALSVYDVYDKPTAFGSVPFFSLPSRKNNKDLKPERTKSTEVGLDFALFKNRIGLELTYYDATTFDQIIPVQITGATGYTSKYINAGSVNNKGIEAILNVTPVRTKDFNWTLTFNFAKNKNEVVELYDENTKQIVIATFQSGVSLVARPGEPYGVLLGRGFVYTNGQKTVRDDGYYMSKSAQVIGNITPDWFGGVGSTLSWKNLSLNFLISAKFGGDLYSLDQAYGQYTGMYPETAGTNDLGNPVRNPLDQGGGLILDGVKEDGSKNDIRVDASNSDVSPFGIVNNPNEAFVYDASFVKLREVNLTYSLNKKLFENSRFVKGADISLTGKNLWIIHKNLPYADPEDIYSAGNVSGHQGGAYPSVRTVGFNVKLRF
ncbi:MAG: SusC/RagA family TonB-linked outer membrane protein [Saprospiraceae bacterium]|nr:SusC/RagA family TonB-linked outer membrane protein [Saprospiraceae bacterium]